MNLWIGIHFAWWQSLQGKYAFKFSVKKDQTDSKVMAKNISYQDSVYLVKLFPASKSAENAKIGKFESSADSTSNQEVN